MEMSFVKCFDAAAMVIEEAGKRFGPTWRINEQKEQALQSICAGIDAVSDEFDGSMFEVSVDEVTREISIMLVCENIVVRSPWHMFYEIADCTSRFSVNADGENICLKFVFPGIWDKAV